MNEVNRMKDYYVTVTTKIHFTNIRKAEKEYKRLLLANDGNPDVEVKGIGNSNNHYQFYNGELHRGTMESNHNWLEGGKI